MTDSKPKQKALCVATRCSNVEQFVATFHRFCDDSTFFVATLATRPVGLETAFSIQLEDKTPVLRGLCSVVEAWATPANRFGRPGVRLAVKRLTNESIVVFRQLQTARKAAEAAEAAGEPAPPVPSQQIQVVDTTPPLDVPIATATIPSSPDTAAAFATLKITALAPKPPALPAPPPPVEAKPAPEAKPPRLPPLRPIPNATPPAFAVFPAPMGAAGPQPSVRADATPTPAPTPTPTPATPAPTTSTPTPMPTSAAALTPTADPAPPTTAPSARTDATPVPSSARPRSDAMPPPRPIAKPPDSELADSPAPRDYVPEPISASDDLTNPVATETRTPGSSFVLPANPLMHLSDKSLEGFVDCALYEETGNFFRAPEYEDSLVDIDDVIAAPPAPARPAPRTLSPVSALRPNAFVPAEPEQDFAPDMTPLPYFAGIVPQRADTDPPIPPTPHAGRAPTPPVYDENAGMFYPRGHEETGVGMRPPPTQPPPNMPMAMEPIHAAPMHAAPMHAPPAPRPMAPLDSTASLIAINRQRDRKRWLVIGASAAGSSLLLLIIVLATSGGGANQSADAATPAAKDPVVETTKAPAIAKTPTPPPTGDSPKVPQSAAEVPDDPPSDPTDPNAPPVAGTGPCRVTVTSSPAGSMVSVDDQPFGPSPISIDGPCAKRRIDVKHPRYALGTKWVALSPGKPSTVDLALARPTHSVTVTSTPSGATVSIAGRRAGTTPTQVKVMGFTGVTLTVEKAGFRTETQKLYSKSDGERLTVRLVRGK